MIAQNSPKIDIVIPVYNEGENILRLLNAFEREVKSQVRLLICYDHEEDTTLTAIKNNRQNLEIVPVKNKGKLAHGAVITGFQYSEAPAVISYMADDDYNAAKIDKLIELFKAGYDVVCPSRFVSGGSMVGCPWPKSFLVRASSFLLYYLAKLPSHDATNGFRLFSRRVLEEVSIESTEGFTYSIELLVKCHRKGMKITELPVDWFERESGKSRFQVFKWASAYLRWFFYAFETTYLHPQKI